jgi:DNA-directed RNA polymerase specialized sigma24 family protein
VKSGQSNASTPVREYATEADFCQLFREQMNRFYFLSLLLTADAKKAERCFVTSLESCMQSRRIFKNWAHHWATHTIIKTAIQMVAPAQDAAVLELHRSGEITDHSAPDALLAALQSVPPLDRFVHHMTVVERYSDLECAKFLGCTTKEVRESRERSLQRLASNESLSQMVTAFDAGVAKEFLSSFAAKAS